MQAPIDVTEGNRKRKLLLQKLAQQQGIGMPPSVARPVFGGSRPFFSFANLPPAPKPQLTRPFPIPPGLARLLGPGSTGTPLPGEFSPGPGIPVGDPGQVTPPPPPGPDTVGLGGGRHFFGAGAGEPIDPTQPPPPVSIPMWAGEAASAQPIGGMTPSPSPSPNPASDALASSLIPLGGGGYFNPYSGTIHGNPSSRWFSPTGLVQ
jgi:hypothetical protein